MKPTSILWGLKFSDYYGGQICEGSEFKRFGLVRVHCTSSLYFLTIISRYRQGCNPPLHQDLCCGHTLLSVSTVRDQHDYIPPSHHPACSITYTHTQLDQEAGMQTGIGSCGTRRVCVCVWCVFAGTKRKLKEGWYDLCQLETVIVNYVWAGLSWQEFSALWKPMYTGLGY